MKKILALLMTVLLVIPVFSSCKKEEKIGFERKVAREMFDNGWVYTFGYDYTVFPDDRPIEIENYYFFGINMRYRYDDAYIETYNRETDKGDKVTQRVHPGVLRAGFGPADESRDMSLINDTILDKNLSPDELLALNPDDYEFETVDKEMFFRLMREALTEETQPWGNYGDLPTWTLLSEKIYLDGYKLQIGFMSETGNVDELYIDVLYSTGEGFRDYVQLSDLVDAGKADEAQKQVWEKLKQIEEGCKESENLLYGADDYKNLTIGGIDLGRVYNFLNNLHQNNYYSYVVEPYVETIS